MCPDRPPAQTQHHAPPTASVHGAHTCLPVTANKTAKQEGAAGTPHACVTQQGTASEHCSGPPQALGLRPRGAHETSPVPEAGVSEHGDRRAWVWGGN